MNTALADTLKSVRAMVTTTLSWSIGAPLGQLDGIVMLSVALPLASVRPAA